MENVQNPMEQRMLEQKLRKKNNFRESVRVFFGRGILSKICFGIILIFIFVALFCPMLTSYTPYEQNLKDALKGPSAKYLLGTDNLGRDLMTRLMYGARISLVTGLLSSLWAAAIGVVLGMVAGYFSGVAGQFIMRLTDAQLSIPPLILTMVLAPVMGGTILGISFVIGISSVPTYARMIYGQVLSLRENDYVTASSLVGQSNVKILFKHILPNCFATLIVMFTMSVGNSIMIEAGLAYLGVGLSAPTPAWGTMISEGYNYLIVQPRLALLPGFCLMLLVISLSIVGDGLRDALDPKLRGKL